MRKRLEPVADRTSGRRQLECEGDSPRLADRKVLDHSQAHDVAAEIRVLDR